MGHRPSLPRNKLEIRGSVSRVLCTFPKEKAVIIHLGCPLPNTSCNLPGRRPGNGAICRLYLVLLPTGFTLPWPLPATRCALTAPFHPYLPQKYGAGGLLSVALSLESPPPDVIRRRVSVEPGLSSPAPCRNKMRRRLPDPLTGDWHRPKGHNGQGGKLTPVNYRITHKPASAFLHRQCRRFWRGGNGVERR